MNFENILCSIKEGLCSSNTPYKVYEVDGVNVIDLDKLQEELYSKKIECKTFFIKIS